MYFDILSRVGVLTSVTDGRTDRQTEWPLAIERSNRVTRALETRQNRRSEHAVLTYVVVGMLWNPYAG